MTTPRFGWTHTVAMLALVSGVALSSLLGGSAVEAKNKHHHKPKEPKQPAIITDVSIRSIKVGPDGGDPTHRTVLVEVANAAMWPSAPLSSSSVPIGWRQPAAASVAADQPRPERDPDRLLFGHWLQVAERRE